jgi:hypothetical protein
MACEMYKVENDVAELSSRLEETWNHLVDTREQKLKEVDQIQDEMRKIYPILMSLSTAKVA